MSVIRFRDLVKTSGTPEPKSLWSDPKHDRNFMKAVKEGRVLTVVQGAKKKDFGEVGFHQHPGALYFVFPKTLPAGEGKVVGIKYDLVETVEPRDVISPEELKSAKKALKTKRPQPRESKTPEPAKKEFRISVRRTAIVETNLAMEASSKADARKKAAALLDSQEFDLSKATIRNEIRSVR